MKRALLTSLIALTLLMSACTSVKEAQRQAKVDDAVSAHVHAAIVYLQQDDPNNAKRHLSDALKLRPHNAQVQHGLALLYRYLREPVKEEKHLKKALEYNPDFSPARNNYGLLLYSQQRYDEAVVQFRKAASDLNNPSSGLAWANLGRCYEKMGLEDKEINAFSKAVRLNSARPSVYLKLVDAFMERGDYGKAQLYYHQYKKRQNPQRPEGLWLGIQLATHTHDMDARASYELALENLYPSSKQYKAWKEWKNNKGKGHQ